MINFYILVTRMVSSNLHKSGIIWTKVCRNYDLSPQSLLDIDFLVSRCFQYYSSLNRIIYDLFICKVTERLEKGTSRRGSQSLVS